MRKAEKWAFWPFPRDFHTKRVSEGARGPLEVAEDLLDTARVGPVRLLPTAGVCDQH